MRLCRFAPGTSVPNLRSETVPTGPGIPNTQITLPSNAVFSFYQKKYSAVRLQLVKYAKAYLSAKDFIMNLFPLHLHAPFQGISRCILFLRHLRAALFAEKQILRLFAHLPAPAALPADILSEHLDQLDRPLPAL